MEQEEKQFLYSKIHFLTEQVQILDKSLNDTLDIVDKLVDATNRITIQLEKMQSDEYIYDKSKRADAIEISKKLQMAREIFKRGDN